MATRIDGPTAPNGAFDVSGWFAAWTDHGGIAVAGASRLYLGRMLGIDRQACARLDQLRDQILYAQACPMLARLLEARASAEDA